MIVSLTTLCFPRVVSPDSGGSGPHSETTRSSSREEKSRTFGYGHFTKNSKKARFLEGASGQIAVLDGSRFNHCALSHDYIYNHDHMTITCL